MVIGGNFVFIHVPRTGGMSITEALGGRLEGVPLHLPRSHIKTEAPTFGFVRNPWQRMVSLYRFLTMKGRTDGEPFDEWLTKGESWLDEDVKFKRPLEPLQRRPCLWWLEGCTHIGMFERLDEDLKRIANSIGFDAGDLPKHNATVGGDWRREYVEGSIAFVREHFAADIEAFGYTFGEGRPE